MTARCLSAALLFFFASSSLGDVTFVYEPTSLEAGVTTTVTISVSSDEAIGIGFIQLGFSASDPSIQLAAWRWLEELDDAQGSTSYLAISDLPDDIQTVYVQLSCDPPLDFCIEIPGDGSLVKVGELDVLIDAAGNYLLDGGTEAIVANANDFDEAILTGLSVGLTVAAATDDNENSNSGGGGGGGGDTGNENSNSSDDSTGDDDTSADQGDEADTSDEGIDDGGDDVAAGEDDSGSGDDTEEIDNSSGSVEEGAGNEMDADESDTSPPAMGFCGAGMIGFGIFTFGALSVMKLQRRRPYS